MAYNVTAGNSVFARRFDEIAYRIKSLNKYNFYTTGTQTDKIDCKGKFVAMVPLPKPFYTQLKYTTGTGR